MDVHTYAFKPIMIKKRKGNYIFIDNNGNAALPYIALFKVICYVHDAIFLLIQILTFQKKKNYVLIYIFGAVLI